MKVGPDAGRGQPGVSVAAAPTAVLEPFNTAVTRRPRRPVGGSLDDAVGWPLSRVQVIQPGEGAHRVRNFAHWSRSTLRRGNRVRSPRRAFELTRESGTCACTRK